MHVSQQHHSSYLDITALAPAADAGRECVHAEVVEDILDILLSITPNGVTWIFSHPLKLIINKAGASLWLLQSLPSSDSCHTFQALIPKTPSYWCQFNIKIFTQFLKSMN